MFKSVDNNLILDQNKKQNSNLDRDYEYFLNRIERININYKDIEKKISNFNVALPSWGVGTGGTRFFRGMFKWMYTKWRPGKANYQIY